MTIAEHINHQDGSTILMFASIDEPAIPTKEKENNNFLAKAPSLPSTTSRHRLTHFKVPRACKWDSDIPICDDTGSLRFKVLDKGCLSLGPR